MSPVVGFIVPVNEVMDIGDTYQGEIMFQCDGEGFFRVSIAVCDLDSMQQVRSCISGCARA